MAGAYPHTAGLAGFGCALRQSGVDFQILRFNYRVIGVADIFLGPVLSEILGEGFLRGLVEARERGLSGTEVFPEEGHGLRRAEGIVEVQFLLLSLEVSDFSRTCAQSLGDDLFYAPE